MKINTKLFLLLIFFLALALRFYKLGSFPSMYNDEAAVGYNAWSILKTGKDEFGESFPLFFRSFGEGKPPMYVYQAVLPIKILGLNLLAVRFLPALMGSLTVVLCYFFCKESIYLISKTKKHFLNQNREFISLISALMLAIMPWHVHFSRGLFAQEFLFWIVLGCYLSIKFLNEDKLKYWILTLLSFSIGLLTYNAAKAVVPLWILFILIYAFIKKQNLLKIIKLGIWALVLSGSIWLLIFNSPYGKTRMNDLSIFSQRGGVSSKLWQLIVESQGLPVLLTRTLHNKVQGYFTDYMARYASHFDPDFLFFVGDTTNARYQTPEMGQLMLAMAPFMLIGLYLTMKYKFWPVVMLLLFAPVASSLSFETPSSVRSIQMTVPLALITALGLVFFIKNLGKMKWIGIFAVSFLFFYNLIFYLDSYYVHQKFRNSHMWQYGFEEMINKIEILRPNYEKVVMSGKFAMPYIYFLFYKQYDPNTWQSSEKIIENDKEFSFIHIRNFENISFVDEDCPVGDGLKDNYLYICNQTPGFSGWEEIARGYYPNQKEIYLILEKKKLVL